MYVKIDLLGMPNYGTGWVKMPIYGAEKGHPGKSRYLISGTGESRWLNPQDETENVLNFRDGTSLDT